VEDPLFANNKKKFVHLLKVCKHILMLCNLIYKLKSKVNMHVFTHTDVIYAMQSD